MEIFCVRTTVNDRFKQRLIATQTEKQRLHYSIVTRAKTGASLGFRVFSSNNYHNRLFEVLENGLFLYACSTRFNTVCGSTIKERLNV